MDATFWVGAAFLISSVTAAVSSINVWISGSTARATLDTFLAGAFLATRLGVARPVGVLLDLPDVPSPRAFF